MIDNWFTNKCMTLVGANGRALAGEALELAELALQEVKAANHKVWTDRNGNFYHKERRLFALRMPSMMETVVLAVTPPEPAPPKTVLYAPLPNTATEVLAAKGRAESVF